MKLRPYHNPQRADEALVPNGWRMLYADEFPLPKRHKIRCRLFQNPNCPEYGPPQFGTRENCTGQVFGVTYIVTVKS